MCGIRASLGVRSGVSGCAATAWVSESSVGCKLGSGAGASLTVSVTSGVGVGSVSGLTSYDVGGLTGVVVGNGGRSGGDVVSVVGAGFGASR